MGKKRKHKHNSVKENIEEKTRIREKVLKVFRARVGTSTGGPAILVRDSPQTNQKTSSIHVISSDESANHSIDDTCIRRHRKKKKRSTGHVLVKEKSIQSLDVMGISSIKDDVKRHLETAQNISFSANQVTLLDDRTYSMISHNRITKRLGLFNRGKKSQKILRGTITIPETVKKKTEAELFKILSTSDMDLDPPDENNASHSVDHFDNPSWVNLKPHENGTKTKSNFGANQMQIQSHIPKTPVVSQKSSGSSSAPTTSLRDDNESLPSSPLFESLGVSLLQGLHTLRGFEDKDLAKEICDDLRKLFKHNDAVFLTPQQDSVLNESNGTMVCRSLFEAKSSFSKEHEQLRSVPADSTISNHKDISSSFKINSQLDANIQVSTKPNFHFSPILLKSASFSSNFAQIPLKTENTRSLKLHDNFTLKKETANARVESSAEIDHLFPRAECGQPGCMCQALQHLDSSSRHRCSMASDVVNSFCSECSLKHEEKPPECFHLSGSQESNSVISKFKHCNNLHFHASHCKHMKVNPRHHCHPNSIHRNSKVVTEYMPQFHEKHLKDIVSLSGPSYDDDITAAGFQSHDADILDYLDQNYTSLAAESKAAASRLNHQSSPGSAEYPSWYAMETLTIPLMPPVESPTSPPKLYPRRLY